MQILRDASKNSFRKTKRDMKGIIQKPSERKNFCSYINLKVF